jgi:hypothetical protein
MRAVAGELNLEVTDTTRGCAGGDYRGGGVKEEVKKPGGEAARPARGLAAGFERRRIARGRGVRFAHRDLILKVNTPDNDQKQAAQNHSHENHLTYLQTINPEPATTLFPACRVSVTKRWIYLQTARGQPQ